MIKLLFVFIILAVVSFGTEISNTKIDIYKNISFLTKTFIMKKSDLKVEIPINTKVEDIDIKSESCRVKKIDVKIRKREIERIKKLEDEIVEINDKISDFENQLKILNTISIENKKVIEIEELLKYFSKRYLDIKRALNVLKSKLKSKKDELSEEYNKGVVLKYKELHVNFSCPVQKNENIISVTYPLNKMKIKKFYQIFAYPSKSKLVILSKIKILQNSGKDIKNVDLVSHSNVYNFNLKPLPFSPRYLDTRVKRLMFATTKKESYALTDKEVIYKNSLTNSSFILKNITLPNNKEIVIKLDSRKYFADFSNDIDGYGSKKAYLKGKFKSDIFYSSAVATLYLNDNKIGKTRFRTLQRGQTRDIFFGENQNIVIKKEMLKDFKEEKFFGNKVSITKKWNYVIKNVGKTGYKLNLIERIPISKSETIKVQPLFDTDKCKVNNYGKVVYSFELNPREKKSCVFAYEITKPKD